MNPVQGWATIPANVLPCLPSDIDIVALVGESVEPKFSDRYNFEIRPVLPEPLEMYHPVRVLQRVPEFAKHLRSADIVHSFITYPYLPAAALALTGTDVPLTTTALGTYAVAPLNSAGTRLLLRYGYRQSDSIFCISEYTQERIQAVEPQSKTSILPLGIDTEEFGDRERVDAGYILSVGAIKERKGQDLLTKAFTRVADDFPEIDLRIVGPTHSQAVRSEIEDIVDREGLEDRVTLVGAVNDRDEIDRLYANCTLFALTPRVVDDNFEGFGLVYLEAGINGKPSVATRSGGVPTAVKHKQTGLLAEEGDISGVADALRTLLADEERRGELGAQAREYAQSLSWERYTDELVEEWSRVTRA